MKTKRFYLEAASRIINEICCNFPHLKVSFIYKRNVSCLLEIRCPEYPIFTSNLIEFIRNFGYEYYVSLISDTLNIDLTERL